MININIWNNADTQKHTIIFKKMEKDNKTRKTLKDKCVIEEYKKRGDRGRDRCITQRGKM